MARRGTIFVLILLAALLGGRTAAADGFSIPGLEADSRALATELARRAPAGLTPAARRQLEQRAADAAARDDVAGTIAALEQRLGAGDGSAELWQALARAYLRATPPDPARAAQAAWQAFSRADSGAPEVPSLLLMAEAFRARNRLDAALDALEAAALRSPDDPALASLLTATRRLAGVQVRRVTTEPEADPPGACIEFTTPPRRSGGFVASDWVRLQPAAPDAAVTREGDRICIAGLPLGATTRVILRAGLPGEDGLRLNAETTLAVAMANRRPRLGFDSRMFLLPRGQAATVTLSSVNLSRVKLRLLRVSERNAVPGLRDTRPGEAIDGYAFDQLAETGRIVWEGAADLPHWQPNRTLRTALPLPDAFAEPGVYLLQARPGDGTPEDGVSAVQTVIRTDLAPTVWRGQDGLTVQVRSYADAAVRPGVRLTLLSRANDILAEAATDPDGVARFAAPLLHGTGAQAPQAIHGMLGSDFVALDLTSAAFDLSDRGVEGAPQPGPLDGFAWTDRGIYRPGETVHLMALLRDSAGRPRDLPVHVRVRRPNGQVFLDQVPPRGAEASLGLDLALPATAPAGEWSAELLADPKGEPIGRARFRVEAFVPDRMAVELTPQPGPLVPGEPFAVTVAARFLYGAPAAHLTGSATLRLVADPEPPLALAGYAVGLEGELFAPDALTLDMPVTDAQGRATLPVLVAHAPDTTRPVRAELEVGVDDPSGRASRAQASLKVRPPGKLVGLKPLFAGRAIDAGGEAAFEIAAVAPDGASAPMAARLKLVRERPDWRLVRHGGIARYETVYRDEPVEAHDIQIPADAPLRFARRLDFGRYRLEVAETGGLAATSVRFRAGWVASDTPDTPDKVDVSSDRRLYHPGETARLHVSAPFAGQATLLTLTDRVLALRSLAVPAGDSEIELPVGADWGPGAYAALHLFRGPDGSARPARAIGLVWLGIDPGARTLPVAVEAGETLAPRAHATIAVRTAPGAWVSLAAVDEGVLRLTGFRTPDPAGHFLGRRTLGIDIRDDWGRLIAPGEGEATLLKQGGDEGGAALPEIPQKIVALFSPPRQAGPDGLVQVPLDLPDFNGQVRLMAVAFKGDASGSADADVLVRDPLIAEPLLPRFLTPGDEARLGVLLQALGLPAGEATVDLTTEGPLTITGETHLAGRLEVGAQVVRATTLRATGAGRGTIHLTVHGPGGFAVEREAAILIRPSRAPATLLTAGEVPARTEVALRPALETMLPGTAAARLRVGGAVRYDVAGLSRALAAFPLLCLEQSVSKGLPLAMLPAGTGGTERAAALQAAVASVLDKQRYDGGFGLWSASGEAEPFLSAYATEFLWRARDAGAAVPDAALSDALRYLGEQVQAGTEGEPADLAARAYQLYALALAGQPRSGLARLLAEDPARLPTPLARLQVGASLALANDRPRAEATLTAALASFQRHDWFADRGSALRDQFAAAVLLAESRLLPQRLQGLLGQLPGADLRPDQLSTQEQAWALAAAAALGRGGQPVQVALDGKALPPAEVVTASLAGPAALRNLGDRPVWYAVSTSGVPAQAPPAARNQMRVTRQFLTLSGEPLNLDALHQNTVFILLIEGRAEDGQAHSAMLLQGLPAGWEIAGTLAAGDKSGFGFLGTLTEPESVPATDDRFAAIFPLSADKPAFRTAVRLRAVTPGQFALPGAMLSDMYRPALFARQNEGRITVLGPE